MDRVKFGRALGYGARHAAKTLAQAADAASAPRPAKSAPSATRPNAPASRTVEAKPQVSSRRIPDAQTVKAAGRQAKSSLVTPVVRFSSVVWLQVSGVFFALVALIMGNVAWRARAGFHAAANSPAAIQLYACVVFCALFTYFAVSSFVRAARR
jgi:hypothetical protein